MEGSVINCLVHLLWIFFTIISICECKQSDTIIKSVHLINSRTLSPKHSKYLLKFNGIDLDKFMYKVTFNETCQDDYVKGFNGTLRKFKTERDGSVFADLSVILDKPRDILLYFCVGASAQVNSAINSSDWKYQGANVSLLLRTKYPNQL